jgi:DNA-binding transcriptional ArsR family regulator
MEGAPVPSKPKERKMEIIDRRVAKALGHPLRIEILAEVNKAPMSPREFQRQRSKGLSGVAYHFRELEKLGCIELIDTRQVRGSTEHFYQASEQAWITDEGWEILPPVLRTGLDVAVYRTWIEQVAAAIESGTMEARADRYFTWIEVVLDSEGWTRIMGKLGDLLAELKTEEANSVERMAESGEEQIRTSVSLAGFESPPPHRYNPKPHKPR